MNHSKGKNINMLSPRESQSESSIATTSGYSSIAEEIEDYKDSITRCICGFLHDDGFMVSCDKCFVWQHCVCMNLDKTNIPEEYYCERCSPRPVNAKNACMIQTRVATLLNDKTAQQEKLDPISSNSSKLLAFPPTTIYQDGHAKKAHDQTKGSSGKQSQASKRSVINSFSPVSSTVSNKSKSHANKSSSGIDIGRSKAERNLNSSSTNSIYEFIESIPTSIGKLPAKKDETIEFPIGYHDPSDKRTWICALCKRPDPPENITKKVLNGLLTKVVLSQESTYVAIDNLEATRLPYRVKEEVMVFDGPWLYNGTISNTHSDEHKTIWYNIHFAAYPKDDKCVTEDRLVKINEDSIKIKWKIDVLASMSKGSDQNDITKLLKIGNTDYKKGQKVIVYFGGYLYNGVIMDLKAERNAESNVMYLIHYNGWNKMWDEWITPEKIFEPSLACEEIRDKLQIFCNSGDKLANMQKIANTVAVHEKCKKVGDKVGIVMEASSNWISCKCNRSYHKICTGIPDPQVSFCCANVDIKCLPRSEIKYQDVKDGEKIMDALQKPSKKLKYDSSYVKKVNCTSESITNTKKKATKNQVENVMLETNGVIGNIEDSAMKGISAKVKNSKSMIVCCVCLKIVYTQEEMDTHWEKAHHITQ